MYNIDTLEKLAIRLKTSISMCYFVAYKNPLWSVSLRNVKIEVNGKVRRATVRNVCPNLAITKLCMLLSNIKIISPIEMETSVIRKSALYIRSNDS